MPYEVDPVPDGSEQRPPEQGPPEEGSDDAAPLEAEPLDDPDGRLSLTDPTSPDDLDSEGTPVPPTTEAAPPITPAPEPPIQPDADFGPGADPAPAAGPERSSRRTTHPGQRRGNPTRKQAAETALADPAPTEPVPAVAALEEAGATPAATPVASVTPDLRGRRFHVVRPGESLWSIASALLEPEASAASIAHQVRRLWRLNRARIGTGDPNLLVIGVKLRLR